MGQSMHLFDKWLLERLTASGAIRLGEPTPDVPAAIRLYQESKGLKVKDRADGSMIWELRREQGARPGAEHVICMPIPSPIGSQYGEQGDAR